MGASCGMSADGVLWFVVFELGVRSISEANRHLMDLIRVGDADGWQQLIERYQRRLVAFALGRCGDVMTAEDLVQETFVSFLGSINRFESEVGLETILFQILRRRVVDHYRRRGKQHTIIACPVAELDSVDTRIVSPDSASVEDEIDNAVSVALADAIRSVTSRLRDKRNFRDLKIAESIFYAGQKNAWIASQVDCTPAEVGTVKFRLLQRMGAAVKQSSAAGTVHESTVNVRHADVISVVWDQQRPSCPKRTTLGKYVLELLPEDWTDYVDFHAERLGCIYCRANLSELRDFQTQPERSETGSRLFQSTIGFFAGKREG